MEKRSLENCIASLIQLRDVYSGQLDTSILEELNSVIAALETLRESHANQAIHAELRFRAVQLIANVVSLVSNLRDLME